MQTPLPRLTAPIVALFSVALCAIGFCAFAAGQASAAGRYVAFGDSGTTGSGLGSQSPGSRALCWQTLNSYPEFVKSALAFSDFTTSACSAAWVNDLTTSQNLGSEENPLDVAPPQFDALNGTETLITISIGDNDTGYGDIVDDCLSNTGSGTPCKDQYVTNGVNYFVGRAETLLSYPLGVAIDEAHRRAPNAEVWVIGYPRMVPEDVSNCPGKLDISAGDAPVVNDWQRAVNNTSKATANAHHAYYLDVFSQSDGHDACQSTAADRWVNPKPAATPSGWSHHPTLAGHQAVAALFVDAFNSPRPPFPPDPTPPTGGVDGGSDNPLTIGQTLSLKLGSKNVRAVSSRLAPITNTAPSKDGAKLDVTLARGGKVDFFIDRAKPGRIKNGKCRSLSKSAGKGRKACTRYVGLGASVSLSLPSGSTPVYFTGRANGKRLSAGKYRVRAVTGILSAKTPTFTLSN